MTIPGQTFIAFLFAKLRQHWPWLVCVATLTLLGLFLLGHDWFGLNGFISIGLALVGTLLALLMSFIMAAFVLPMVGLITAVVGAFIATVTTLLAFVVGGIFTPLAALVTGWVGSLLAWLGTTWLGSLLMPLYNLLAPIVLKIAPWITTSKYALKAYDFMRHRLPENSKS